MCTHKKILLVDDDDDDCMFFTEVLTELEPTLACSIAHNGYEAINQLEKGLQLPTIIFLDLNMPVMNGFECLVQIRKTERYKDIPVVVLTTADDTETRFHAIDMGANFFLKKASDYNVMKAQMHDVLERDFATSMVN
ncbi:MAG: response regulator [Bacteroidota bacterium]